MTAPGFDPELVEQAARVLWQNNPGYSDSPDAFVTDALAVLTAVAPTLRADGAAANEARWLEGVERAESAYQRGKVEGARQVFAELEAMVAEWGQVVPPLDPPRAAVSVLAAAREAVTRIADGAPS